MVREPALNEFSPFKVIKCRFLAHYMVYTEEGSVWLQDRILLSLLRSADTWAVRLGYSAEKPCFFTRLLPTWAICNRKCARIAGSSVVRCVFGESIVKKVFVSNPYAFWGIDPFAIVRSTSLVSSNNVFFALW